MLGVHQEHADIRDNQFDRALPNKHNITSILKQAGYQTGLIGKWRLQGREVKKSRTV
jgi:arylsulfatase A-like enzyme